MSRQLLGLARDPSLWRNKVFEKAPSATQSQANRPNALAVLTGALGGLSIGDDASSAPANAASPVDVTLATRASRRAKAVVEWDNTHSSEKIDWYSEYVARHAPLSIEWAEAGTNTQETRGMALFGDADRVVTSSEEGDLAIWDITTSESGRRGLVERGRSRNHLLFQDSYSLGESSIKAKVRSVGTAVENISVDTKNMRAFVASDSILSEVDLDRMQIVSQNKYAWAITALSQETEHDCPLTVGTSWSLHIYDPRQPLIHLQADTSQLDVHDDPKIAFLPNYTKAVDIRGPDTMVSASLEAFQDTRISRNRLEAYARVEPGPQSILHLDANAIVIAGRMPSILFYDRRNFPSVRSAIHSGARLSALTTLPVPPAGSGLASSDISTLIACGEYGGRGSIELYQLPWESGTSAGTGAEGTISQPFSYKNRQEASSSKILSVATQGARIVFSDSEGMLKWVERDGRGLARRWNINAFQMNDRGASVSGEQVVRKMVPLPEEDTKRGSRGDGDLLIWTGEKVGIVTTKSKPWNDHDELVKAFERGMDLNDREITNDQEREDEYATMMRRALERQADERRWMSRFGGRRW